mgnify:CR=1 FL=1
MNLKTTESRNLVIFLSIFAFSNRRNNTELSALDTWTTTTTSTRFSHRTTLSARKPMSFWREKRDTAVVILVRGFAKMLSSQNKSTR